MAFLLDTNVISCSKRPEKRAPAFQAFMRKFRIDDAFLSVITIMEIRFGVRLEQSRNAVFSTELERWLTEDVLVNFSDRILPFDTAIALRTGALPTPNKRPSPDAMIAATALHHGLTVVTRNISDFEPLGVPCLNPWTFQG